MFLKSKNQTNSKLHIKQLASVERSHGTRLGGISDPWTTPSQREACGWHCQGEGTGKEESVGCEAASEKAADLGRLINPDPVHSLSSGAVASVSCVSVVNCTTTNNVLAHTYEAPSTMSGALCSAQKEGRAEAHTCNPSTQVKVRSQSSRSTLATGNLVLKK